MAHWSICMLALMPPLLARSAALGYGLVLLAILLGVLAVCIPSMRKATRRTED